MSMNQKIENDRLFGINGSLAGLIDAKGYEGAQIHIRQALLSIAQEAQNETIEALRLEEREIPKEEQPTSLVGAIGRTEFARDSGYNQAVKEQRKKEQALKEDT